MMILFVIVWLVNGAVAGGFMFTMIQREFPALAWDHRWRDAMIGVLVAMFGPFGFVYPFVGVGYKHGLHWEWPTELGSKVAFYERWPHSDWNDRVWK